MIKKLLVLVFFLFSCSLVAQTTSVTATITDTDGQTWNNGACAIVFVPNSNYPTFSQYKWTGGTLTQSVACSINSSGVLTASVPDNLTISPINSLWNFTLCPYAKSSCVQTNVQVTGTSQTLTSQLSAIAKGPRFNASAGAYGYSDTEINPTPLPGGNYFNVVSLTERQWNGTSWQTEGGGSGITLQTNSVANSSQTLLNLAAGTNVTLSNSAGTTTINATGGGGGAFSALTSGTNTTAAMVVGTGASLTVSGSGSINATTFNGVAASLYALLASPIFTGTLTTPGCTDSATALTCGDPTTTSNYTVGIGTNATGSAVLTTTIGSKTGSVASELIVQTTNNAAQYMIVGDQFTANMLQVNGAGVYEEGLNHADLGDVALSYGTKTNCSSSASPAVCGSSAGGNFVIAASTTSIVVNTTDVDANSQIYVFPDESLGTKLGVTCNTTNASALATGGVTARTAGTSFTYTTTGTIATNPACYSYLIIN